MGQGLAARPARAAGAEPHGGLTFTPLRSLALLPEASATRVVGARLRELRDRAAELPVKLVAGEAQATWPAVIATLEAEIERITGAAPPERRTAASASPAPIAVVASAPAPSAAAVAAVAAAPAMIEEERAPDVTILFDSARCIHARHCVLQAPTCSSPTRPAGGSIPRPCRSRSWSPSRSSVRQVRSATAATTASRTRRRRR